MDKTIAKRLLETFKKKGNKAKIAKYEKILGISKSEPKSKAKKKSKDAK